MKTRTRETMKKTVILLALCFLAVSCLNRKSDKPTTDTTQAADSGTAEKDTLPTESELEGYPIDYHSVKVIETVYVTDRRGVDARQEPDENAKSLLHYNYGDRLEVIDTAADFYGIRSLVARKWQDERSWIEGSRWEKVFVKKSDAGGLSEIKLIPDDLNVVSCLDENNNESSKILDRYLDVELIDKETFDSLANNRVDYFVADTATFRKVDGVITLKAEEKEVRLVDRPIVGDGGNEFSYLGQYEILNQYVIYIQGNEWWGYDFYDKTTGEASLPGWDFDGFPYLSPNRKYIICISGNPYDPESNAELYGITDGGKIERIMTATYMNWMPVDAGHADMFWASDGCFYLKVIHTQLFYEKNPDCQYLRIKLLGV